MVKDKYKSLKSDLLSFKHGCSCDHEWGEVETSIHREPIFYTEKKDNQEEFTYIVGSKATECNYRTCLKCGQMIEVKFLSKQKTKRPGVN